MNKHDFVRFLAKEEDITIEDATKMTTIVLKGIEEALKKKTRFGLLTLAPLILLKAPLEK